MNYGIPQGSLCSTTYLGLLIIYWDYLKVPNIKASSKSLLPISASQRMTAIINYRHDGPPVVTRTSLEKAQTIDYDVFLLTRFLAQRFLFGGFSVVIITFCC